MKLVDVAPTMRDMNQWNETEALGSLIIAESSRSTELGSIIPVFQGDRFNLSMLAASLGSQKDGPLTRAAVEVLTMPRKFTRHAKSFNKAKVTAEQVLECLAGKQQVSLETATFVAHLIHNNNGLFLRVFVKDGDGDTFVEFDLDMLKLEEQLRAWGCTLIDFVAANREKRIAVERKSDKKGKPQRKSMKRVFTLVLENDNTFIRNWAIPLRRVEDESEEARKRRIRAMQNGKNRYSVLPDAGVVYGM